MGMSLVLPLFSHEPKDMSVTEDLSCIFVVKSKLIPGGFFFFLKTFHHYIQTKDPLLNIQLELF